MAGTVSNVKLSQRSNRYCFDCKKKLLGMPLSPRCHCHLCGEIFCDSCTKQKALIPPASITLIPNANNNCRVIEKLRHLDACLSISSHQIENDGQPKLARRSSLDGYLPIDAISEHDEEDDLQSFVTDDSFSSEEDYIGGFNQNMYPHTKWWNSGSERTSSFDGISFATSVATSTDLSYANTDSQTTQIHLYGHGLEKRMKVAREPLRVCRSCHSHLQHLQEELRNCNSNAVRYNSINPTGARRLLNSPMAFTLGHEVRKAAYTLSNLLPMPKKMELVVNLDGGAMSGGEFEDRGGNYCSDGCTNVAGNLANVDGVKIPARLLERARGVAFLTVVKVGMGFTGFEFGTGLVVCRLPDNTWSAPCAIGTAGISWGALVGLQLSDHVLLLMTDNAVDVLSSNEGSIRLGVDVGVALGPIGRNIEAGLGSGGGVTLAPIYTYSFSKGFYMGASFQGKVLMTRHKVNERFYGQKVEPRVLLKGDIPAPPAAQPLYNELKRCHAYTNAGTESHEA